MFKRFAVILAFLASPALAQAPEFEAALPEYPATEESHATTDVVLETTMGAIVIALETERAPITAANFLRYVDEGRFDGIVFYRAMQLDWGDQPNGLIQGGAQFDPDKGEGWMKGEMLADPVKIVRARRVAEDR